MDIDWVVENIRVTVFPGSSEIDISEDWWDTVSETPSTEVVTKKATSTKVESGLFSEFDYNLRLESKPDRIDWIIVPSNPASLFSPSDQESPESWKDMGSTFCDRISRWFDKSPQITRVAFGAVLLTRVKDKVEGYQLLQRFLNKVEIDEINSYDFTYVINRPRNINVNDSQMLINRLNKWGTIKIQGFSVGGARAIHQDTDVHMVRLELDINTDAKSTAIINPDAAKQILKEMFGMAVEISVNGDIP